MGALAGKTEGGCGVEGAGLRVRGFIMQVGCGGVGHEEKSEGEEVAECVCVCLCVSVLACEGRWKAASRCSTH